MNESNRDPSESRFKDFFSNLPTKVWILIAGTFSSLKPVLSFLLKLVLFPVKVFGTIKTFFNLLLNKLDRVMYAVVLISGLFAIVTSMIVEYQVMTEVYGRETDISKIPFRMYKVSKKIIIGDDNAKDQAPIQEETTDQGITQEETTDQGITQDGTPHKQKSWLPLLFVWAVEGMKCSLIFFFYSRPEGLQARSVVVLSALIVLSFVCTFTFLTQLMHKPHEDVINQKIQIDREATVSQKISKNQSLSVLRNREKELMRSIDESYQAETKEALRGGHDRLARGIAEARKGLLSELETTRQAITTQENYLKTEAINERPDRESLITKDGRALDPRWMSALLSAVHEAFYPEKKGEYPRALATIFMFGITFLMSFVLESIIIEAFTRLGKETLSSAEPS